MDLDVSSARRDHIYELKLSKKVILDVTVEVSIRLTCMDTNLPRAYPFLENNRPFFCISLQVHVYQTSQRTFFTLPFTDTDFNYGPVAGGFRKGARTFTADTFFAHLLTLRMFRVYVFMSISQSGHMADTNGSKRHVVFLFCFFIIEVFP